MSLEAPRYIPDNELTPEQLAERKAFQESAAAAAASNANLRFNPETGAMEPAEAVHEELERMQGEQH